MQIIMKTALLGFFVAILVGGTSATFNCDTNFAPYADGTKQEWTTMEPECITLMKNQVQRELNAALTYLAMGAHFSEDVVNRPGFAKMFFESAGEEREHAIKFIEYLLMRGELVQGIADLIHNPYPAKGLSWNNGLEALQAALALEASVTRNITEIIKTCENPSEKGANDYHLVDYLTGEFLEEQYRGQRDLAGKISTLGKMVTEFGDLGEYLFDKKLYTGEVPVLG